MFYDTIEFMQVINEQLHNVKICPMLMIDDEEEENAIGFHEFTQEYAVSVNDKEFRIAIKDEYIKVPNDFPSDLFPLVKEKIMEKIKMSNKE